MLEISFGKRLQSQYISLDLTEHIIGNKCLKIIRLGHRSIEHFMYGIRRYFAQSDLLFFPCGADNIGKVSGSVNRNNRNENDHNEEDHYDQAHDFLFKTA